MNALPKSLASGLVLVAALVAACAGSRSQSPEWDGLVRQWNTRLNGLFVRPDAGFAEYHSVMLDPVEVSFARAFNRGVNRQRLSAADLLRIQESVSRMVRDTFTQELTGAGYQLVEQPSHETLRITASVVNLFISAPDTMPSGRSTTFTADPGRMTLVLEIRDSVSGEILARAVDTRTGGSSGVWTITNRVTNTGDAQRAIRQWAVGLRQALGEVYAPKG